MPKSRLDLALPRITAFLNHPSRRVLRLKNLRDAFHENHEAWKLPSSLTFGAFMKALLEKTELVRVRLPLPHRRETLYAWDDVPMLVVALAAKARSYLTHFTAMGLHELTSQVSKTIYVNVEQRPQPGNPSSLSQESIDRAFRNQQRRTTNMAEYGGYRLLYLNGKFTNQLGVIDHKLETGETIRVTGLERTLIDIAVRPAYSGGVPEVAAAYRKARERVDIKRMLQYLREMQFVYPYEQAIGYYFERAGYSASKVAPLRKHAFKFNFYLAHGVRDTEFVPEWKLFVPKGLQSANL